MEHLAKYSRLKGFSEKQNEFKFLFERENNFKLLSRNCKQNLNLETKQ